jgi:hypothetical protein
MRVSLSAAFVLLALAAYRLLLKPGPDVAVSPIFATENVPTSEERKAGASPQVSSRTAPNTVPLWQLGLKLQKACDNAPPILFIPLWLSALGFFMSVIQIEIGKPLSSRFLHEN